jgi:hypothetical protein
MLQISCNWRLTSRQSLYRLYASQVVSGQCPYLRQMLLTTMRKPSFAALSFALISCAKAQSDAACSCSTQPDALTTTSTIVKSVTATSYYSTVTNTIYQAVVLATGQTYTLTESTAPLSTSTITVTNDESSSKVGSISGSSSTNVVPNYNATSMVVITITPPDATTTGTTTVTSPNTIATRTLNITEVSTLITSRPHPSVRSSLWTFINHHTRCFQHRNFHAHYLQHVYQHNQHDDNSNKLYVDFSYAHKLGHQLLLRNNQFCIDKLIFYR